MRQAAVPVCVVGVGQIGMRHVEVAQALDTVTLTAVVEPHADRAAELSRLGLPVVHDIAEVPVETRGAVIATPTNQHVPAAQAALERGFAVLVEKPIGASLGEAKALIAQAKALNLPLFTGHHRRLHPFVQEARERLAQIGQVVALQGFWSLRKHDSYFDISWRCAPGAGPLMTNLSHEIELLQHLFGPIAEVSALLSNSARKLPVEDTAALSMRFASGALGSFTISDAGLSPWAFEAASGENPALAFSGQDYIRVTGQTGALGFPSLDIWRAGADGGDWRFAIAQEPGPKFTKIDPLKEQMRLFAQAADGASASPLCTGQDGLAALDMTLAAALSGQTGHPVQANCVPDMYQGV